MMGLKSSLCWWPALLVLAAASLAVPALAGDDPPPAAPPEQAAAQVPAGAAPVGAAGIFGFIDPETGGLSSTPTDAQRAEMRAMLANSLNWSYEGLAEVAMPDGSFMLDLQGRFLSMLVVQVAPDGTRQFKHVAAGADAIDASPAAPTAAPPTAVAAE
jgi:hypothetical protein